MKNKFSQKNNKGYAILFTVAVVAVISLITIGLSNATYKQMILSSVARDSSRAFYEADIASECSLFADDVGIYDDGASGTFNCAGYSLGYTTVKDGNTITYTLDPIDSDMSKECFHAITKKEDRGDSIGTTIETKGYNICDTSKIRTVERAIRVTY